MECRSFFSTFFLIKRVKVLQFRILQIFLNAFFVISHTLLVLSFTKYNRFLYIINSTDTILHGVIYFIDKS